MSLKSTDYPTSPFYTSLKRICILYHSKTTLHSCKMAGRTKKVRRLNPDKKANKDAKKKTASDGMSKARKTLQERREKIAGKKASKEKLEKELENAAEEEAKKIQAQIDIIMGELQDDENAVQEAETQEAKFKQDERDADNEDEFDEVMEDVENTGSSDSPLNTTEYDPTKLIAALLSGTHLGDSPDPLDLAQRVGLRNTEAVIGYKSTGMYGKVGLVIDTEFENWQIYRIKKNVVVGEDVPNIVESRRAGVVKDRKTKEKWKLEDMCENGVKGIAIAVPPGYTGNVEDLLVPRPKRSAEEKEELRRQKKLPKLVDVQLLIQWKEPDTENRFLSWENRTGCRTLWKKNGDLAIWNAAKHYESHYRKAGGKHASEERDPSLFEPPPVGSTLSPEGTPGPDETVSTTTTPGGTPGPGGNQDNQNNQENQENQKNQKNQKNQDNQNNQNNQDNAAEKKATRAQFKVDWCEDRDIDPQNMSDKQVGSMMASFTVYWNQLNKGQV